MDRPHRAQSDSHRRLPRHTYQEGPGFLFLATRGGRPPGPRRREDLTALRFRIRCVRTRQRGRHRGGPGPRCQPGQPASLAHGLRGGRPRGAPVAATGTSSTAAAGLARAGRHRGAPPDVLEQQAPRRGVHAPGHLPARPPRGRCPPRRVRHGTTRRSTERAARPTSGACPTSSGTSTSRDPSSCSVLRGEYTKVWIVGLVDDHSRFLIGLRVLPRPRHRAHPRLAARLLRAVRACRSRS